MSSRKAPLAVLAGLALAVPSAAVLAPASADDIAISGLAELAMAETHGIEGEYIVFLNTETRSGESLADLTRAAVEDVRSNGVTVDRVYNALGGYSATLTDEQVAELRKDSRVDLISQDRVVHLPKVQESADSEIAAVGSWGIDRIDQPNLPLDSSYRAPGNQGRGVHAYVIDTGISNSPEFRGRVGRGRDVYDNDSNPADCQGHGSHVAGTVAGSTVGVAPQATIHPVRVFGCGTTTKDSIVTAGIDWATDNAQKPAVANMSIGGPKNPTQNRAVQRMADAGIVPVVAAGNEDTDACRKTPASVGDAITVASTTRRDVRSDFSNYGRCVDIFAPGSSIRSVDHEGGYKSISGTSMASPHVAGAAALVLGEDSSLGVSQVTSALTRNAARNKVSDPMRSPNLLLQVGFLGNGGGGGGGGTTSTTSPGGGGGGGNAFFNNSRQSIDDYRTARSEVNSTYSSANKVKVEIDINHSCLENLEIAITTPDGVRNVVKRSSYAWRCSAWRGTKSETYPLRSKSDGSWVLEVGDNRRGNTGTLNGWGITLS